MRLGRRQTNRSRQTEFYYGFVGVAVAWQVLFLVLGRDPVRYRPIMLPATLEKLTCGLAVIVLFLQGRVPGSTLLAGLIDLALGALFLIAYVRTRPA